MGSGPNRRCDTVTDPDFFESYTKYPCAHRSVDSPMIFTEALLEPTVPSEPRPKNMACTSSAERWCLNSSSTLNERWVTSS